MIKYLIEFPLAKSPSKDNAYTFKGPILKENFNKNYENNQRIVSNKSAQISRDFASAISPPSQSNYCYVKFFFLYF